MKPGIYGYIRVTDEEWDEETIRLERDLRNFAEKAGFCVARMFYEDDSGSYTAFHELADELERAEVHHVLVPSLIHLSNHPLLRRSMLIHLEDHASARILEVK